MLLSHKIRDWRLGLLLAVLAVGIAPIAAEDAKPHAAITPAPRDEKWMVRHEAINKAAQAGPIELVFLGDSITQGWNNNEVWKKYYGHRKPLNAGIGGDRTQHVLWRLDNGNIDGLQPKLVVMMIGTNNSRDNSAAEITDGVTAIVKKLGEKLPETKVLVLAVFPRGEKAENNPQRDKLKEVNQAIAKLADDKRVYFLDIGPKFLKDDGSLGKDIMPDFLHLSPAGYQIWAESIEPQVSKLLGDDPVK